MPDFTLQDAEVDQLVADLATLQADYDAAEGRYWQGIHTNPAPADDATEVPDTAKAASDHPSWAAQAVPLPVACYTCLEVHAYDGPAGRGYCVKACCVKAGVEYLRVAHAVGPESWRDSGGWQASTWP